MNLSGSVTALPGQVTGLNGNPAATSKFDILHPTLCVLLCYSIKEDS